MKYYVVNVVSFVAMINAIIDSGEEIEQLHYDGTKDIGTAEVNGSVDPEYFMAQDAVVLTTLEHLDALANR